jgi:hypothetical protein
VAPWLQIASAGVILLRKPFGLAIAAIVPFVMVGALLTPQPLTATYFPNAAEALDKLTPPYVDPFQSPDRLAEGEDEDDDLLGNPVSPAVATYKFDAAGSLYETHSPQTELPRLGSPKS